MKYILTVAFFLLLSILEMSAQRREFHPTIDVGINGGLSFSNIGVNNQLFEKGKLKQFNFNVMSNTGYSRHLLEVEFANPLNNNEFNINPNENYQPSIFSANYTFAYELFAYYPACMIRNQLMLGLRLNTEFLLGGYAIDNIKKGEDNLFISDDFGQYSADISFITDYHLNKKNYIVMQLYSPIATLIANKIDLEYRMAKDTTSWAGIQPSSSTLFTDMEFVGLKRHTKIGLMVNYRILLSDFFAVQLKYHGKFNSQTDYQDPQSALPNQRLLLYQNHHQLMVGIVGHFKRMPIGF